MSCHESPLKQKESLEKKKKERREDGRMFAEDTNTSSGGGGGAGGGERNGCVRGAYNINVWVRMRMTAGVVSVGRCARVCCCVLVCGTVQTWRLPPPSSDGNSRSEVVLIFTLSNPIM